MHFLCCFAAMKEAQTRCQDLDDLIKGLREEIFKLLNTIREQNQEILRLGRQVEYPPAPPRRGAPPPPAPKPPPVAPKPAPEPAAPAKDRFTLIELE